MFLELLLFEQLLSSFFIFLALNSFSIIFCSRSRIFLRLGWHRLAKIHIWLSFLYSTFWSRTTTNGANRPGVILIDERTDFALIDVVLFFFNLLDVWLITGILADHIDKIADLRRWLTHFDGLLRFGWWEAH